MMRSMPAKLVSCASGLLLAASLVPPLGAEIVERFPVTTGLDYLRYEEEGLVAHVLKMDLKEKDLRIRSIKAKGKETIRQFVERIDSPRTKVLAAINGDFFRQDSVAGLPYGVQVSEGRLIFAPMKRSMIGFGPANEPYIGIVSLKAQLAFATKAASKSAKWLPIDDVNVIGGDSAKKSGIYLYTPAFLELKLPRRSGFVAVVDGIEPDLQVGDVCEGKVRGFETTDKPVDVPETGCLLYFFGDAVRSLAAAAKVGQPVSMKIELPPIVGGVTQALGGGPRLVRNGRVSVEIDRENFSAAHAMEISKRHPRSAIGYDASRRFLYVVMVEGRHDGSRGMTFSELGTFLRKAGCYQAMAFDGGGSAGMYVTGKGMVSLSMGAFNRPEEREIANGLLITMPWELPSKGAPTPAGGGTGKDPEKPTASGPSLPVGPRPSAGAPPEPEGKTRQP